MVMIVTTPGFDTLVYARRLKEAGVDDAQAEAHAEAMRDAITESVATKADIARLEAKIDTGLAGLKAEIAASERRTMIAMLALAGVVVAIVTLLP